MERFAQMLTLAGVILALLLLLVVVNPASTGFSVITGKVIDTSKEAISCTDSDGLSFTTRGAVTIQYADGSQEVITDACEGSSTVDYTCSGNTFSKSLATPSDCSCDNGACSQCSAPACNPSSIQQICSNGRWTSCPADQVCFNGVCIIPTAVTPRIIFPGGSSDDSSSTSSSSSSSATASSEPTRSLGELPDSSFQELTQGERLLFTLTSIEHSIKLTTLSTTQATLIFKRTSEQTIILNVGDETSIDFTNDGTSELRVKLKSINVVNNKLTLLITRL